VLPYGTPDRMDRGKKGEVKVSMWLPRPLWKRAKLQAADEGRALRLVLLDALATYLKQREDSR
jgi:hypothetical protein